MKNNKGHIELFGPGGCLTKKAIELYLDNELDRVAYRRVQQHSRNCLLCRDALEGAEQLGSSLQLNSSLTRIAKARIAADKNRAHRRSRQLKGLATVAASVILLLGIFFVKNFEAGLDSNTQLSDMVIVAPDSSGNKSLGLLYGNEEPIENIEPLRKKLTLPEAYRPIVVNKTPIVIKEHKVVIETELLNIDFEEEDIILEHTNLDASELSVSKVNRGQEQVLYMSTDSILKPEKTVKKLNYKVRRKSKGKSQGYSQKCYFMVAEVIPLVGEGKSNPVNQYLVENLREILPDSLLDQPIVVGFKVDTLGRVGNVKLITGTSSKVLNKQIINVVKGSPVWTPNLNQGSQVAIEQHIQLIY